MRKKILTSKERCHQKELKQNTEIATRLMKLTQKNKELKDAIRDGKEEEAKKLIAEGANISEKNIKVDLWNAVENDYEGIVKLLIEAGADSTSLIIDAVKDGKLEIVKLLIEAGAIENMKEYKLLNLIH